MTKYYFMLIQTDYLQRGRATVSQFLCLSGEQLVRYWNCIKPDEMGPPTPTQVPTPPTAHHKAVTEWLLIT